MLKFENGRANAKLASTLPVYIVKLVQEGVLLVIHRLHGLNPKYQIWKATTIPFCNPCNPLPILCPSTLMTGGIDASREKDFVAMQIPK
jgi:hypothetical protein